MKSPVSMKFEARLSLELLLKKLNHSTKSTHALARLEQQRNGLVPLRDVVRLRYTQRTFLKRSFDNSCHIVRFNEVDPRADLQIQPAAYSPGQSRKDFKICRIDPARQLPSAMSLALTIFNRP